MLPWFGALIVVVCFGELTARTDDWIFQNIPFLANPDREHDLLLHDSHCVRGRPHGRFKKYTLNAFGFRGPEIAKEPTPGTTRIMILGASETFGLYESPGHEYPTLVREAFAKKGDNIEVINAAVAGMTLPSLTAYWNHWAKDFHPDIVVIYPSPLFYLDNDPPQAATPRPNLDRSPGFRSRFLERLIDTAKQSAFLKTIRGRLALWRAARSQAAPPDFNEPPAERLKQYADDLETLIADIRKSGARVVLVTHAFKADQPLTAADRRELDAFRVFFPRALPSTMAAFETSANLEIDRLGKHLHVPVIDAAADLTGKRDHFGDPVHFNDAGSKIMADRLVRDLTPLLPHAKEDR